MTFTRMIFHTSTFVEKHCLSLYLSGRKIDTRAPRMTQKYCILLGKMLTFGKCSIKKNYKPQRLFNASSCTSVLHPYRSCFLVLNPLPNSPVCSLPAERDPPGPTACNISTLEADGWRCRRSSFSPTPGSLGRSDISLINELITAEALKGAERRARIPKVRSKLARNAMRRDFFARASPKSSPLPTLTQIITVWGPLRAVRQKRGGSWQN